MSDDRITLSVPRVVQTVEPAPLSSLDDRRRIRTLEAQVQELEGRLAAALRTVQPAMEIDRSGCHHYGGTIVDDDAPRILCKECGEKLDPYAVLRRLAHEETRFCYSLNALREEQKRLAEEVEALKRKRGEQQRKIRRGADAPPAGLAARMREAKVGALHLDRAGKTPDWTVSAWPERAGRTEPRGRGVQARGPLEDAIEGVLAEMAARSGG